MVLERLLGGGKPIDDIVIGIQKVITYTFIFLLIFLVGYNAFGSSNNTQILNNTYLPIVSGWIGIILGFYFSREIADIISKKLKESQRERKEENEKVKEEYKKFKEETSNIIIELLNKQEQTQNGKRTRRKK